MMAELDFQETAFWVEMTAYLPQVFSTAGVLEEALFCWKSLLPYSAGSISVLKLQMAVVEEEPSSDQAIPVQYHWPSLVLASGPHSL